MRLGREPGWSLRRKQGVDEKLKAGTAEERGDGNWRGRWPVRDEGSTARIRHADATLSFIFAQYDWLIKKSKLPNPPGWGHSFNSLISEDIYIGGLPLLSLSFISARDVFRSGFCLRLKRVTLVIPPCSPPLHKLQLPPSVPIPICWSSSTHNNQSNLSRHSFMSSATQF
jgi:hypothetical protein